MNAKRQAFLARARNWVAFFAMATGTIAQMKLLWVTSPWMGLFWSFLGGVCILAGKRMFKSRWEHDGDEQEKGVRWLVEAIVSAVGAIVLFYNPIALKFWVWVLGVFCGIMAVGLGFMAWGHMTVYDFDPDHPPLFERLFKPIDKLIDRFVAWYKANQLERNR